MSAQHSENSRYDIASHIALNLEIGHMHELVRKFDQATVTCTPKEHLPSELSKPLDDGPVEVNYCSEGAFTKHINIFQAGHHTRLLFRVPLHVKAYSRQKAKLALWISSAAKPQHPWPAPLHGTRIPTTSMASRGSLWSESKGVTLRSVWRKCHGGRIISLDGRAGSRDQVSTRSQLRPSRNLVLAVISNQKTREYNAPDSRAPIHPSRRTLLDNHETSSATNNPKNEAQLTAESAKKGIITGRYSLVKTASERTMLGRNTRASPTKRDDFKKIPVYSILPPG